MGRTPPVSLERATDLALKKIGQTSISVFPLRTCKTNEERAARKEAEGPAGEFRMSLRCCRRRPLGPPDELAGNECIALATISGATQISVSCKESGEGGRLDAG